MLPIMQGEYVIEPQVLLHELEVRFCLILTEVTLIANALHLN